MAQQKESLVGRVRHLGIHSVSLVDLCAIGFSRREEDANTGHEMGQRIAKRLESIMAASHLPYEVIQDTSGLQDFEALRCLTLIEIGRRSALAGKGDVEEIEGPGDVLIILDHLMHEKREHFYAILLDSASHVMRKALIHIGTLTMSIVGPREVYREAVRDGASSIIVAHNHPSGDPTPSPEDIEITKHLVQAGKLMDIPVLDHVIIGHRDYRSLNEMGLM
ncbi:MAG: repair protein RadC [Fimbriimonadaceae bacterium]|nr:repair protein RadC [Fimbriimonadaceae bacterium]